MNKERPVGPISRVAIITPSYRNDLALCRDLHASLAQNAPADCRHLVIVPRRDLRLFDGLGDVRSVSAYLPRFFRALPRNLWLNTRQPMPLLRGWIVQQIIKLAAAAASDEDVVMLADSDMVFVKPITPSSLRRHGAVRFYRSPGAIDGRLPRHVIWHHVAHRLLGLPPPPTGPLPDYICWPMIWDPVIVRKMLDRVAETAGTLWETAIGRQIHFSEGILYGVFVDCVLGGSAFAETTMLSAAYSDTKPLDRARARAVIATIGADQIAVMISAKSATDLAIRREAIAAAMPAG